MNRKHQHIVGESRKVLQSKEQPFLSSFTRLKDLPFNLFFLRILLLLLFTFLYQRRDFFYIDLMASMVLSWSLFFIFSFDSSLFFSQIVNKVLMSLSRGRENTKSPQKIFESFRKIREECLKENSTRSRPQKDFNNNFM